MINAVTQHRHTIKAELNLGFMIFLRRNFLTFRKCVWKRSTDDMIPHPNHQYAIFPTFRNAFVVYYNA